MSENIGNEVQTEVIAPVVQEPVNHLEEKVFSQIEVNDLIRRERAAERAKQEARSQQQPKQPAATQGENQEDYYRRIAAQEIESKRETWVKEAQTKHQEAEAERVANEFLGKIAAGKDKYADFDEMANIDFGRFPYATHLANMVDNTADVVYELGRDRTKLAQLEMLAERSPQDALTQIKRMAKALKENEAAAQVRTPNAPLDRLKPSNAGTNTGAPTVKGLRGDPRFRV